MWNTFNIKTRTFSAPQENTEYKTTNVVAYLRISTSKQDKEGKGLESQQDACVSAEQENWHSLKRIFQDKAISWKVKDREWLLKCLAYIKETNKKPGPHNIKYLYCTEISRISRPEFLDEWLNILRQFWEAWVIVYDVFSKDYYERWDDLKIIQLVLKLYSAKQERENGNLRSRNWVNARLKAWYRAFSSTPIGYTYEKRTIWWRTNSFAIQDHPNAGIMAKALRLYADGTLYNAAEFLRFLRANKLTTNYNHYKKSDGTKDRKCKIIHKSLFENIMKPRRLYFYAWYIVAPDRWITEPIPANHEPIINDAILEWVLNRLEKAQEERPAYTVKQKNKDYFHLRKILRCEACWRCMSGYFAKDKYPKYDCKYPHCPLKDQWIPRTVNADKVHDEVEGLIKQYKLWEKVHDIIKYMTDKVINRKKEITANRIKDLNSSIEDLEHQRQQIEDSIMNVTEDELRKKLEQNRKDIGNQIESLQIQITEIEWSEQNLELKTEVLKFFENPVKIWKDGNSETKNLLLKVMFDWVLKKQKNRGLRTPVSPLPLRVMYGWSPSKLTNCPQ